MENQEPIQNTYNPSPSSIKSSKKPPVLLIIIAILIIAGVVLGAKNFIGSQQEEVTESSITPSPTEYEFPTETPTPTTEETPTPTAKPTEKPTNTPTPKPTVNPIDKESGLNRSNISIEILNGSGVAGAAGKTRDLLQNLGYKVTSIGNADNENYEKTVIEVKSASSDYLSLLKKDLSNYTIGTASSNLSADSSTDAKIIIGKQ